MCLGVFLLGSSFFGTLWASWIYWNSISFARLGNFSFIMFSNKHPYDSDVGTFKLVPEVPKPLLIFLNSCFFVLFQLNVYFFLLAKSMIWVSVSFLSLLVPCTFSFISLCVAFTSFSILQPHSTISVSILITSVLNSASDRLAISSWLSSIFGALICSFFFFNFYCYSITVVCLFSPSLHPTPAEPTSLPHLHPPPWFCPCVLYSSSCNPLFPLSPAPPTPPPWLLLDCS